MFGVTTSDDYRPVAWMGRYPVDVTTMLVGVHVAAAILAAILVAFGAGSSILALAAIRQRSDLVQLVKSGDFLLMPLFMPHRRLLWFAIEMYLLFVFGRKWNVFSDDALISHSMVFCWSRLQRF